MPAPTAGSIASGAIPSSAADRHRSAGSPVGSAAASSSSRCVATGSCCARREKVASIRLSSGSRAGRPKPPATSVGDTARGSSSNASGLPRASARIRSRTRRSSGAPITDASSSRAFASGSPSSRSCGSRANASSSSGSRTANSEDDRVGLQATGHERERLRRRPIKPLDVIDEAQHRRPLRSLGEQAEHGETDQEAVRRGAGAQPEGRLERVALWRRQPIEMAEQRCTQLMESRRTGSSISHSAPTARTTV